MSSPFSESELATLRMHRIVIFADRVIFDAQPPIDPEALAWVRERVEGDLPNELVELWSLTAGGSLDYELVVRMNGRDEVISWNELFYRGSNRYQDLYGWVEHERELAEEAADDAGRAWSGRITDLPIGGFEYLDRIYIGTVGNDFGKVVAWKQGLPPAWTGRMHEDGIGEIGQSLRAAFAALTLNADPRDEIEEFQQGEQCLAYIASQVESGLEVDLADRLVAFYLRAVVDWCTPLSRQTIASDQAAARAAIGFAIAKNDAAIVHELFASGVDLDGTFSGAARPIECALNKRSYSVVSALVDLAIPVPAGLFASLSGAIPADLVRRLCDQGAVFDVDAMITCIASGSPDAAVALAERGPGNVAQTFSSAKVSKVSQLTSDLKQVRKGRLSHWLGEDGLVEHIARLESFTL